MATVQEKPTTIIALAEEAGTFATLLKALQTAGLTSTLKGEGPFTVFAPNEGAFRRLPKGTLKSMLRPQNRESLEGLLKYHVVEGRFLAADVAAKSSLDTLSGTPIRVEKKGNVIYLHDARIRRTNLEAQNGVVHVIDRVLRRDDEE